jgi:coenzyme PQQ precursor peptide PqqA
LPDERRRLTIPARPFRTEDIMAWKKPRVTEISLALEINCYACADIG